MKTPAETWNEKYPELPFDQILPTSRGIIEAAFQLGAVETTRAFVEGEHLLDIMVQLEMRKTGLVGLAASEVGQAA